MSYTFNHPYLWTSVISVTAITITRPTVISIVGIYIINNGNIVNNRSIVLNIVIHVYLGHMPS